MNISSLPALTVCHFQDGSGGAKSWHRRLPNVISYYQIFLRNVVLCKSLHHNWRRLCVWAFKWLSRRQCWGSSVCFDRGLKLCWAEAEQQKAWLYQLLLGDIVCFLWVNVLKGICWNVLQNSHNICADLHANMEHIPFTTWALFKTLP